MKGYLLKRPLPKDIIQQLVADNPESGSYMAAHLEGTLPAISLVSQSTLISAITNDTAPDSVYAQQGVGYGRQGDVLMGIITSGNSRNCLYALQVARTFGLRTIGLLGPTVGAMKSFCDIAICVPGDDVPTIQENQLPVYHTLCAALEKAFFI